MKPIYTVTCVVNGHKEGKILAEAISSVLASANIAMEMGYSVETIVVLDSCDEATRSTAESFGAQVQIHETTYSDLGLARNYAVSKSQGDLVAFLDGDDLWSVGWLASAINLATQLKSREISNFVLHPEVNLYFTKEFGLAEFEGRRQSDSVKQRLDLNNLALQNLWTALCVAPRTLFVSTPYLSHNYTLGLGFEDWDFNIRSLANGVEHYVVPESVHFIRVSQDTMRLKSSREKLVFSESTLWFGF